MNLDIHPFNFPNDQAKLVWNGILETDHFSNGFFMSNEESNRLFKNLPCANILGHLNVDEVESIFLWLECGLYVLNTKTKECKEVLVADCLNFTNPIQAEYKVDECGNIELYWIEDFEYSDECCSKGPLPGNKDRFVVVDPDCKPLDKFFKTANDGTKELDCCKLIMALCYQCPEIELEVNTSGGRLSTGIYQFVVLPLDNMTEFNWCSPTNPVSISHVDYLSNCFEGAAPGTVSNHSIDVIVTGVEEPFFKLAVIRTINGVITPFIVGEYTSEGGSQRITYTGDHLENISLEEILTPSISYEWSGGIQRYNNKLLKSNVCDKRNIDYQRYANEIKVSAVTVKLRTEESYNLPDNVLYVKSAMRDEVYSGAIRWVFCDGTKSEYFHIPGPSAEEVQECLDTCNPCCGREGEDPEDPTILITDNNDPNPNNPQNPSFPNTNYSQNQNITINAPNFPITLTLNSWGQTSSSSGNPDVCSQIIINLEDGEVVFSGGVNTSIPACNTSDISTDQYGPCESFPNSPNCFNINNVSFSGNVLSFDLELDALSNINYPPPGYLVTYGLVDTDIPEGVPCDPDVEICNNLQGSEYEGQNIRNLVSANSDDIDGFCEDCDNFIGCPAPIWEVYNTACITCKPHLEPIKIDDCGTTKFQLRDWEVATLAFWESADHVYPEIEVPCKFNEDGSPVMMYGDLTGQPVRYWKMPDTRLMCHFSSDKNPEVTEINELDFTEAVEVSQQEDDIYPNDSKPWDKSYVYPLLLRFDNITPPDELDECRCITGYEISIVTRTDSNKSVVAKGVQHGMFASKSKLDGKYYAHPNLGVNSNNFLDHTVNHRFGGGGEDHCAWGDVYLLADREILGKAFEENAQIPFNDVMGDDLGCKKKLIDARVFHSPNTCFRDPIIAGDYLKVEKLICGHGVFYGATEKDDVRYKGSRMNFNLFKTHRPEHCSINRKMRGIQKGFGDSIVSNVGNITYPLMNLLRESSIYYELEKHDLGPLQLHSTCRIGENCDGFFGVAQLRGNERVQICRYDCSGGGHLTGWREYHDSSFKYHVHGKYDGGGVGEGKGDDADIIKNIGAQYVSIKRYLKNHYGAVTSQIYESCIAKGKIEYEELPCGEVNGVQAYCTTPIVKDIDYVGVDSFINYYAYLRTSKYLDYNKYRNKSKVCGGGECGSNELGGSSNTVDQWESSVALHSLVHHWYESDINVAFRYDLPYNDQGGHECLIYPQSVCSNEVYLDPSFDDESSYENVLLGHFHAIVEGNEGKNRAEVRNWTDKCCLYNNDYSLTNKFCGGTSISLDYDVCCLNCFSTRVIWSESEKLTSVEDSWRTYLANNFIDLPKHTGNIIRLVNYGSEIYAHMTDSLWRLQATNQQLNLGSEIVFVGSGDLFSQVPSQLYVSDVGYGGLQFREASYQNEFGYFWVDAKADKIHHLLGQGQVKEISNNGLRNFFKENKLSNYSSDRPFLFGFDHRHNRLLFTKRDEFTLSYMPDREQWISFHSYLPDYYLQDRKDMWTFKNNVINPDNNNSIWLHNRNCTSFQTFYGSRNPFILEVVLSVQSQRDLESLYVVLESYKHNVSDPILPEELENCISCEAVKQFYDKMHIYNYCQSSGILPVHVKKNGSDVEEIRQAIIASNDCSRWDINGWRDAKCDNLCPYPNYPFLDDQYSEELSFTETENSFTENNSTISCNYYIIRFILDKTENRIYHLTHSLHQMPSTNERSS